LNKYSLDLADDSMRKDLISSCLLKKRVESLETTN